MKNAFYKKHKQLIDQSAHFVVGGAVVLALALVMPALAAIGVMLLAATVREIIQHRGFDLGWGSALDLLFFLLGGIAGGWFA